MKRTSMMFGALALVATMVCSTARGAAPGRTFTPRSGDELQKAIHDAAYGDTILLEPGVEYRRTGFGAITLEDKGEDKSPGNGLGRDPAGNGIIPEDKGENKSPGGQYITIRSSALVKLPEGKRMAPGQAVHMPKILSPGASASAIVTTEAAHHYKLLGLEVLPSTPDNRPKLIWNLLALGSDNQKTPAQTPRDLVIDRCYIHGLPDREVVRGIALNSASTTITNCYISEVHYSRNDSQAICGWNGPGPFTIDNNYIEGAGENIMFGGSDSASLEMLPTGIRITRNDIAKPLSWNKDDPSFNGVNGDKTKGWVVKNLMEFKVGRNVHIEGNRFENGFRGGPGSWGGSGVCFHIWNQNKTAPWSVVKDVTFCNNVVRNTATFVSLNGPYGNPAGQMANVRIVNNLWVSSPKLKNEAFNFLGGALGAPDRITIAHNTLIMLNPTDAKIVWQNFGPIFTHFLFTDNIMSGGSSITFHGDGYGPGYFVKDVLKAGGTVAGNVIIGGSSEKCPAAGNQFPATPEDVGFVNYAGGDYRLTPASKYKKLGSDGKDPGVDMDALNAAMKKAR